MMGCASFSHSMERFGRRNFVAFLLRELRQMFRRVFPIDERVFPRLQHALGAIVNLPEQTHNPFLESRPAGRQSGGGLSQFLGKYEEK